MGDFMAGKWYKILAPKIFNEEEVGQTTADEAKKLIGRTVEMPLPVIFKEYGRNNNILIKLRVDNIKENKALTSIISYSLIKAHLVRLVRRGVSRIDVIDNLNTKDGRGIRVKIIIVTNHRATRKQRYSIRKRASELIKKQIPEYNWEAFILALITSKFQGDLKKKLKKIYPIRYVEVRRAELV